MKRIESGRRKPLRHIRRKFLKADKVNFDTKRFLDSVTISEDVSIAYKVIENDNYYPVIITEQNELIQAFLYQGPTENKFIVPEPNFITVYFDIAQSQIRHAQLAKAELLTNIGRNGDVGKTLNYSHTFLHHSCISVVFMFSAVEAFINLLLPVDKEYIRVDKNSTSHFSHEQIQIGIPIEEKIKCVLPQFLGRSFHIDHSHKYEGIIRLKEMRNEIAHTKANSKNNNKNFYRLIFTNLLNFDLESALHHAKDFINYFQLELIEECNCGRRE